MLKSVDLYRFKNQIKKLLENNKVSLYGKTIIDVATETLNASTWGSAHISDANFSEKVRGEEGKFSKDGETFTYCDNCCT